MNRTVVLQPQYFPWRGVFEQIRLAQSYVHLDDADVPQGRSLLSRVQLKTAQGSQWLTVPVRRQPGPIAELRTDETQGWRQSHLRTLQGSYSRAPYFEHMMDLVREVFALQTDRLCDINVFAIERIAKYLGLTCRFSRASQLPSQTKSTSRLVELATWVGAKSYLTGHGALAYLSPEPFEARGVSVEIMDYRRSPYPQLFDGFDPHVSILDLIANTGPEAANHLESGSTEWRTYERTREVST